MKIVPKVWGEEWWIVNNDKYCGKILMVNQGYQSSYHFHPKKDETFYILKGEVGFTLEDEYSILTTGGTIDIPHGKKHKFLGLSLAKIIEFSTHHEDSDTIRLTESGKI